MPGRWRGWRSIFHSAKFRAALDLADDAHALRRSLLVQALSTVLRRDIAIEDATVELARLPGAALADVDRIIRESRANAWVDPREHARAARMDNEADLFVAACDRNGYLRERALQELTARPGRLPLAAALLRAGDRVPEVRTCALFALHRLLPGNESLLWELLGLLLTLQRQQRFHEEAWRALIAPILERGDQTANRWKSITRGGASERLFAFDLVAKCDPARIAEACRHALEDRHPAIARWGIDRIAHLRTDEAMPLLRHGLQHAHAQIRATAFRAWATRGFDDVETVARRLLLDPAAAPRNAADHLLRTRCGVDTLQVWRAVIDGGQAPFVGYAASALAERAQTMDVHRFLQLFVHRKPAIRATALRGLAHADPSAFNAVLPEALGDSSPKVLRQALWLSRQLGVSANLLHTAYEKQQTARTRRRVANAARWIEKWKNLDLLLQWLAVADATDAEFLREGISDWHARINRSFIPLDAAMQADLLAKIDATRAHLSDRTRHALADAVRRS